MVVYHCVEHIRQHDFPQQMGQRPVEQGFLIKVDGCQRRRSGGFQAQGQRSAAGEAVQYKGQQGQEQQ